MKKIIREDLLNKRNSIDPDEKKAKERSIEKKLFELEDFKKSECILLYASFRSEVDTMNYLQDVIHLKKKLILPLVEHDNRGLKLFEVRDVSELIPGYMGIQEPGILKDREVSLKEIDLVVIPGTGFDTKGNRLGYGGGYYDRLLSYESKMLSKAEHIITVALAFEEQIGDRIPAEPHDIKVDIIITDKRVISCKA
ncbi:MAG: 5-formyltetrahydrofolate cyclo-ligase [Thermodesulfovibrionia bacterium]|nr:5-formyltetrahydrofolate cyclo-ligase [Thermodesulfovibrionia bacterium]